jgi:hypothetical protein
MEANTYESDHFIGCRQCGSFETEPEESQQHIKSIECYWREDPWLRIRCVMADQDEKCNKANDAISRQFSGCYFGLTTSLTVKQRRTDMRDFGRVGETSIS